MLAADVVATAAGAEVVDGAVTAAGAEVVVVEDAAVVVVTVVAAEAAAIASSHQSIFVPRQRARTPCAPVRIFVAPASRRLFS